MSIYKMIPDVECGIIGTRALLVEVEWLEADDDGGGDTAPKSAGYVICAIFLLPYFDRAEWFGLTKDERNLLFQRAFDLGDNDKLWDYCQEQIDNNDCYGYFVNRGAENEHEE